jgi:hypothetical protein
LPDAASAKEFSLNFVRSVQGLDAAVKVATKREDPSRLKP